MEPDRRIGVRVLAANTLAFTICFAVWMMNGVLVTHLVDTQTFTFDKAQFGWLIGIPVLTGSILRLPVGILTDRYGGRRIFTGVMLISAPFCWLVGETDSFAGLAWASLGFGVSGTSFAVGIAYSALFFPRERQGTALGIFGAGNAGAGLTSLMAPSLLRVLTNDGANPEGWRALPKIYAGVLALTAVLFWFTTVERRDETAGRKTLRQNLAPLGNMRVWRFGLYYFLVFGGFVALSQWLIPYYVSVYAVSVALAGLLASIFTFPSGIIRALGGYLSDRFGARTVMYWVLGGCAVLATMLIVPRMDIHANGEGVLAPAAGVVESVSATAIVVSGKVLPLRPRAETARPSYDNETLVWPTAETWQEPVVKAGDTVVKRQLLARGVSHIYFQANIWIFTAIACAIGLLMGIGKAAVYKHIPEYFPHDVGVVGGIVGVLGGLGGFVCPILFGYLLRGSGLWTTAWMFLALLSAVSLVWMHLVVRRMVARHAPHVAEALEHPQPGSENHP
ncbi:MAG: NarK/NasA family nitrate transporter [Myxococcales bacterium]|nr:NarK/NasA family nitrate transporter [Myxococcales bacterium]